MGSRGIPAAAARPAMAAAPAGILSPGCMVGGMGRSMSPWAAALVIFVVSSIVGQVFGALGIFGIKLSAVPAVILILAVGIGVEFTLHILLVSLAGVLT